MADESLDMITHLLGTEAAADTVIKFFFLRNLKASLRNSLISSYSDY